MIGRLQNAAARAGLTHVVGQRADAEALDLPEETFDVGLCALGLMYVAEPMRALEHVYRALRPGGRLVVAVWGERAKCGWAEVFPIVERRVASDVCPLFFQMGAGETLRHTLAGAGFDQVEVYRIATTLWFDSGEAACGAAFAGGPVALAYTRFDEPTRAAVHEEYLTSIQAHSTGTGLRRARRVRGRAGSKILSTSPEHERRLQGRWRRRPYDHVRASNTTG